MYNVCTNNNKLDQNKVLCCTYNVFVYIDLKFLTKYELEHSHLTSVKDL